MDNLKDAIFHSVPFLSLMSSNPPSNRPLLTRLSEQSIVGIVAAFVALQVSMARQSEQIETLRSAVRDLQKSNEDQRREIRDEIARMRGDLYAPKR